MTPSEILYSNINLVKNMLADKKSYADIAKVFGITRSSVAGFVDRNLKTAKNTTFKKFGGVNRANVIGSNILENKVKTTIISETVNQCKFLYGNKHPYTQCDESIVKGSYCQSHADLCYLNKNPIKPCETYYTWKRNNNKVRCKNDNTARFS